MDVELDQLPHRHATVSGAGLRGVSLASALQPRMAGCGESGAGVAGGLGDLAGRREPESVVLSVARPSPAAAAISPAVIALPSRSAERIAALVTPGAVRARAGARAAAGLAGGSRAGRRPPRSSSRHRYRDGFVVTSGKSPATVRHERTDVHRSDDAARRRQRGTADEAHNGGATQAPSVWSSPARGR